MKYKYPQLERNMRKSYRKWLVYGMSTAGKPLF
jgi:hypothetical protein